MYEEIKLAIIGSGKWGMNHVRTAYGLLGDNLKCVCDMNADNEEKVKEISDTINFTTELNDVLNDSEINSVIVATPAETHFEISKKCLKSEKYIYARKMVLNKKPPRDDISCYYCPYYKNNNRMNLLRMFYGASPITMLFRIIRNKLYF